MPFGMGAGELIVIFFVILMLFGAKRLPELARSLGRSIKEFKHATSGLREEFDMSQIDEKPRNNTQPSEAKEQAQQKDQ